METSEQTPAEPAQEIEKLEKTFRSGANWFYWIAGLSVVNSVMQLLGSERSFIIGLGITQVFEAIAKAAAEETGGPGGTFVRGVAFVISLLAAGLFALFGWRAGKRRSWAFVIGMGLYALDGLIFLLVKDWLSIGFHVFALFGLWTGYASLRKLRASEEQLGLRPIGPGGV